MVTGDIYTYKHDINPTIPCYRVKRKIIFWASGCQMRLPMLRSLSYVLYNDYSYWQIKTAIKSVQSVNIANALTYLHNLKFRKSPRLFFIIRHYLA